MPLHDPIPYDRVAELISDAQPSQQSVALHDAWREYAAKATRPYAWKTFALYARQQLMRSGDWCSKHDKEKLTPWQDGARGSPWVLVLGPYAALRVRGGALEIEHGPRDDREVIRLDIDAEPKPRTILFDSHGEFLTGEAIRWCARYSINLLLPGGPGRIITMVESGLETNTNTMTRMRDINPIIIRAQCVADPVRMAREIVCMKIEAALKFTAKDAAERRRLTDEWKGKLDAARSVAEIMVVESRAAAAYWRTFRDAGLRERKGGNPNEAWAESDTFWNTRYAAKILPLIPLQRILASGAKDVFLDYISNLLIWTNQKNAPPWVKQGKRNRGASRLFEWTHGLGNMLGRLAGLVSLVEAERRFLAPILALEGDACWALLAPFASTYVCVYVFDALAVPDDAVRVLDLCLSRLLASAQLERTVYRRSGEFSGYDQSSLARTLMFVSVEHAALATRYANGDWSEIDRILPLIDRFVRVGGWAASVMGLFLTLCERAKASYPAEEFANQISAITGDGAGELRGWHGTFIPARTAGLVQHFADRDSPMSLPLAQKFLRILDLLVDMGDRRSAALQLGEAFREVRVAR